MCANIQSSIVSIEYSQDLIKRIHLHQAYLVRPHRSWGSDADTRVSTRREAIAAVVAVLLDADLASASSRSAASAAAVAAGSPASLEIFA